MDRDKLFFRGVLLLLFNCKNTATEAHRLLLDTYGDRASSKRSCSNGFKRFQNDDFDLKDKERPGQPKKFEDAELQLLDENAAPMQKNFQ